ncbi:hypothetical protein JZU46_02405 [bacterium]|jgi:hypothetical protein|nr:hypothetical protein [bacterium]
MTSGVEVAAPSSPLVKSVSVDVEPRDARCKYWAKKVDAETALPLPKEVDGGNDIPSKYLREGEEELEPGDILFEGEANHHRRLDRGWTYWVHYVDHQGVLHKYISGFGEQKTAAKALGLSSTLLAGSGDVAGAVRVAHALRLGMILPGDRLAPNVDFLQQEGV